MAACTILSSGSAHDSFRWKRVYRFSARSYVGINFSIAAQLIAFQSDVTIKDCQNLDSLYNFLHFIFRFDNFEQVEIVQKFMNCT